MNNLFKSILAEVLAVLVAVLVAVLMLTKCHSCSGGSEVAVADPHVIAEPVADADPVFEPELELEPEPEYESDLAYSGGTGDLRFVLTWEFPADMDIYVTQPNGTVLSFLNRTDEATTGVLDIDNMQGGSSGNPAVENVYWTNPPAGRYRVEVKYFNGPESGGPVTVIMFNNGERSQRTVNLTEIGQMKTVFDIDYTPRR